MTSPEPVSKLNLFDEAASHATSADAKAIIKALKAQTETWESALRALTNEVSKFVTAARNPPR